MELIEQVPIGDDNSDDNPDDSCTLNDGHDCPKTGLHSLVRRSACSWQVGVRGSSPVGQECPKTGTNEAVQDDTGWTKQRTDLHVLDALEQ